ncbi:MAG: aryl-sulfate sulfotransferase [Bacteroidales bacterium]|nr:aryl-sulfate sulfotransferase [Bacteroidales bacterium]
MKDLNSIFVIVLVILLFFSFPSLVLAQDQTVGLFENHNNSFNGYTLFNPIRRNKAYLIDNCGREVHSWTSNYNPALAAYLLESGHLLRICRVTYPDLGGRLEKLDWDGQVVWSYEFGSDNYYLHHDIESLPNGNILVMSYDFHTAAEAIIEGRDPSTLSDEFRAENIFEIEPVGSNAINIVWEWHAWDHLIQDFSTGANNYGVVADHPELLNINYTASLGPNANVDWIHFNSIDYNPDLDQIILSSRNISEVFIIDHSTTTIEATGHTGGTYGKGGDILYRFGNPASYNRGGPGDRLLFFQHDAQWIPEGTRDEKKIIVFNNQIAEDTSSVNVFNLPMDSAGYYSDPADNAYGPADFDWSYSSSDIYSSNISGVQRLPNGNTLICTGTTGLFTEIDVDGNIVWRYISPAGSTGPVNQGVVPNLNNVFKIQRFGPDFSGFAGHQLIPGDPIELNPWPSDCLISEDTLAEIQLKAFLEGPFDNNEMSTSLNDQNLLPLLQPFNNYPWFYNGTEAVTEIPGMNIVDWVLVGFRDAESAPFASSSTTIDRQAAFVLKDGSLVNTDGTSLVRFYNSFENGLFISLWHRNHLGIISSNPITEVSGYFNYDFTDNKDKVFGGSNGHNEVGVNTWGMISGDGNSDGLIDDLDIGTLWSGNAGTKGLFQADYNLDSTVDNKDKNDHWYFNQNKSSQVPE